MEGAERPLVFQCGGRRLLGVLHEPGQPARRGLVIVVGGPQTRVGSHRQFLLLARWLAARGVPVLRFDYRGMGDSEGELLGFEHVSEDIEVAIDAFCSEIPGLQEVVLWGLCDAASACMMYARHDARVAGMVLANPWIRSEATMARTYLRHYYSARLLDKEYWLKFFRGEVRLSSTLKSFFSMLRQALPQGNRGSGRGDGGGSVPFPERMREGLEGFQGKALFIFSGADLTAAEFKDKVAGSPSWQRLLSRPGITCRDYAAANHTFSSREWRDQVASWTEQWLHSW